MDNEVPSYKKKKKRSDVSKAEARSDHKHEYEPCIVKYLVYNWGERCKVCGRIRHTWSMLSRERGKELMRPGSVRRAGIGVNDFLSVAEMKEKFPGVRVYEECWENHEIKTKEIFE